MYYYYLRLLLLPNEGTQIPGLAYPTVKPQKQEPDVKTAIETLDRFPSRIDPIKVTVISINVVRRIPR